VSNHSHLLADIRRNARTPRAAQPFDKIGKADLWERLQAAEAALVASANAAQSAATTAHDYAQGLTGEARRQMLSVRDAAYKARNAARAVGGETEQCDYWFTFSKEEGK
jgi:hypothetical protein